MERYLLGCMFDYLVYSPVFICMGVIYCIVNRLQCDPCLCVNVEFIRGNRVEIPKLAGSKNLSCNEGIHR
jgi:hypothetical protein